jgi:hypothetical protein
MARDTAGNDDQLDDEEIESGQEAADQEIDDVVAEDFGGLDDDASLVDDDGDGAGEGEEEEGSIAVSGGERLDDDATDRGDGRNARGEFVKKEGEAAAKEGAPAADKTKAGKEGAAPAAGEKGAGDKAATTEAKWEPLVIGVGRAKFDIPEAQVTKRNGFHVFSVKDDQVGDFLSRLNRSVLYEQNRHAIATKERELDTAKKQLEIEQKAPQRKSDEEIAATITMDFLGDRIKDILTPEEFDLIKARVEAAQLREGITHGKAREDYFAAERKKEEEASSPERDAETQARGIGQTVREILEQFEQEFANLDAEDVKAVYNELRGIARAVYWKEDGKWYHDTERVYNALKARANSKTSGSTSSANGAPPKNGHTATNANGTPAGKQGNAERFNRGVDSAARRGSTSLKDRREPDPRNNRNTSDSANGKRRPQKTAAMAAEDDYRKQEAAYMRSDTLDFPDD